MKSIVLAILICFSFVAVGAQESTQLLGYVKQEFVAVDAQESTQLFGYVKRENNIPVQGATISIGGYSVSTNKDGYYKFDFLKPGPQVISISVQGKPTRYIRMKITNTPTQKDFFVDW
jgi:hypothetical protein